MPIASIAGVNISYAEYGSGRPVVLVTGSGARGRAWTPYQVPALTKAGYRAITMDNRGVPPSDTGPAGFTLSDMVADTAGLIDHLGLAPCRIVGYSLGAMIVTELLVAYPGLVNGAVLMATRGRSDVTRMALSQAEAELSDSGVVLPKRYAAIVRAMQYLSPQTLNSEQNARDWLDIFEMSPEHSSISNAQRGLDLIDNRLRDYEKITSRCLVIGFQDDLIVPSFFGREVAEHIPGSEYREVPGCGHYGYLERPEAVNSIILDFFKNAGTVELLPRSAACGNVNRR
jgi:pimeloyl-ACP methyl ester carboxylesterase